MNSENARAYTEIHEIFKHIPQKDISKIPEEVLKMIEEKRDKNYQFQLQENVEFENQPLLRKTKVLLAVIYRDYWATEYERERITQKWKCDIEKAEEEKRKLYNSDDIFKKKQIETAKNISENTTEKALVEVKKEKFYNKIINFLKKMFHINYIKYRE